MEISSMQRRDVDGERYRPHVFRTGSAPSPLRFRTRPEQADDPVRRRWEAVYLYGDERFPFIIELDMSRLTLTLRRLEDVDYSPMLRELAGWPFGLTTAHPPSGGPARSQTFDVEIIGLRMPGVHGSFGSGPAGGWLVVQAFLPRSAESFLLGVNDNREAGEIAIQRAESVETVVQALAEVFG
jgi:hypothetical protein